MSNPYQNLIDNLRKPYRREWIHLDDAETMEAAANAIELLTKQLAAGPTAWLYESTYGAKYSFTDRRIPGGGDGWKEYALYHIAIPEVK